MAKLGRPEKPIDWEKFEELCNIQCTHDELSSMCKVAKSTLYERAEKKYGEDFPTVYKRFSEGGKCSLRRIQFKLAHKNAAMAIWLGKQYLGQKDNTDPPNAPNDKKLDEILEELKQPKNSNAIKSETNPELSRSE